MKIITYDCEVFAYNWIVVFKDKESGTYTVIHNDNEALKMSLSEDAIYVGFNSKHYDQYIIKAIAMDFSPTEIKQVNDYIIGGGQGWEYPTLRDTYFGFSNVDIRDDMQVGLSLKAIEGHLGLPIRESNVDFNIGRPLTKEEIEETITYCKWDVDTTEKLIGIRKDYLKTKANLGKRAGIKVEKALSLTNAKLTAQMLGAKHKEWNDGREYVYPSNLDMNIIPKEIIGFFNQIRDMTIPDDDLFNRSLNIMLGDMPCTYAWGGVHGSLKCYYEEATGTRIIQNRDVSSLYPTLIEEYNYLSRNVDDPHLYYQIKKDRLTAKHTGDKQSAKDLKTPLNALTGAQENPFNDLYDPLPTRSLRISGQLFVTVLAVRLLQNCKTIKLLNFNTDGLMYSVDKAELHIVDEICSEWEKETKFELETDDISKVWIKDVNNLLLIKTDDEVKTVGGYLNYGISTKGAWSINNTMIIVKKALIEYFVNGTPVEDTIANNNDIFDYQIIAKAGSKFKEVYQIVENQKVSVQKVNRVYATTNKKLGTLYKVKENGATAKIESLPKHCVIDNENQLTVKDIDKSFYIELATKRINDFLGIEPEKKVRKKNMAAKKTTEETTVIDTSKMTVYQKLITARGMFLNANVQKSGKNMHMSFKYFELDDIVPIATKIFTEIGLIAIVNFTEHTAVLTIVDVTNPEDRIDFASPFNQIQPILSREGKAVTNEMQALGSSITYMRRYLYMMALDICESDGIEANIGKDSAPAPAPAPAKQAPATPAERAEIKGNLTSPTERASDLQISGLKNVLKKIIQAFPDKEEMVNSIAVQTQSFTVISKEDCEKLIEKLNAMLETANEV